MLTCSSRPGMRRTQGARPLNSSSDSLVRNRISPIQTNIGSAARVQLPVASQKAEARKVPGLGCTKVIATSPTAASESAIQSPAPSRTQSSTSSSRASEVSAIRLDLGREVAGRGARLGRHDIGRTLAAQHRDELVQRPPAGAARRRSASRASGPRSGSPPSPGTSPRSPRRTACPAPSRRRCSRPSPRPAPSATSSAARRAPGPSRSSAMPTRISSPRLKVAASAKKVVDTQR